MLPLRKQPTVKCWWHVETPRVKLESREPLHPAVWNKRGQGKLVPTCQTKGRDGAWSHQSFALRGGWSEGRGAAHPAAVWVSLAGLTRVTPLSPLAYSGGMRGEGWEEPF